MKDFLLVNVLVEYNVDIVTEVCIVYESTVVIYLVLLDQLLDFFFSKGKVQSTKAGPKLLKRLRKTW